MRGHLRRHTRPDTWRLYVDQPTPDGRRRQRTKVVGAPWTREGRGEAERLLAEWVTECSGPERVTATGTVAELAAAWLAAGQWSPKTRVDHESVVRTKVIPGIGHLEIAAMTGRTLDAWYRSLQRTGLSGQSVRHVHAVVRAMFGQAVRWGDLPGNPASAANPPPPRPRDIAPPSNDQVQALLAAEPHPMWRAYLTLALTTGARRSQILGVRWSDVDTDALTVMYRRGVVQAEEVVVKSTKSGCPYPCALDQATVDVLRACRAWRTANCLAAGTHPARDPWLVTSDPTGTQVGSPEAVKSWWRRLCARADVSGVRLHDLRHWCAITLLAEGVDVLTVAARLGHVDATMVLRVYGHAVPAKDHDAAAIMRRAIGH